MKMHDIRVFAPGCVVLLSLFVFGCATMTPEDRARHNQQQEKVRQYGYSTPGAVAAQMTTYSRGGREVGVKVKYCYGIRDFRENFVYERKNYRDDPYPALGDEFWTFALAKMQKAGIDAKRRKGGCPVLQHLLCDNDGYTFETLAGLITRIESGDRKQLTSGQHNTIIIEIDNGNGFLIKIVPRDEQHMCFIVREWGFSMQSVVTIDLDGNVTGRELIPHEHIWSANPHSSYIVYRL